MDFFVDESGHTGNNLFDENQPVLYYGVLSSLHNIEENAAEQVNNIREIFGVDRLHASELGEQRLCEVAPAFVEIQRSLDINFDFYLVYKKDHAAISFFDQVFDQGMNPAVPWSAYWSPLRYILLQHVSFLFDKNLLKTAWAARIEHRDEHAIAGLVEVCRELIKRASNIHDFRARQIISDALTWVLDNPEAIAYNVKGERESYWVSPNLIGFQFVMRGIASRVIENDIKNPQIIVDQQSQFNKTQRSLAEFYAEAKGFEYDFGTGLPPIDYSGMPETPIQFQSSHQSIGLELVDIYLWLFKRYFEKRELPNKLLPIIGSQITRGKTDIVSLNAIATRWAEWFEYLPELSEEEIEAAKHALENEERMRLSSLDNRPSTK